MIDTADTHNAATMLSGAPLALGASERCGGLNFALFSRHATPDTLLLLDALSDEVPRHRLGLELGLCLLFNAEPEEVKFVLQPPLAGRRWRVTVDAAQAPSLDIHISGDESWLEDRESVCVENRSLAILVTGWMCNADE